MNTDIKAIIVDTETTGHHKDGIPNEVIELAYKEFNWYAEPIRFLARYRPEHPITYGALATHHILPSELEECRPSNEAPNDLPLGVEYLIGHNVDYDWEVLGSPDIKRIDTLAIARACWPDMSSHKLGACLYRAVDFRTARRTLYGAHAADVDVDVCEVVLGFLTGQFNPAIRKLPTSEFLHNLWSWSEDCRVPRVWTFGKHFGKKIGMEIDAGNGRFVADADYHRWCLTKPMDPYLHKAIAMSRAGKLHSPSAS